MRSLAHHVLRALLLVLVTVAAPLRAQGPTGAQNPDSTTEKVATPIQDPGAPTNPVPQSPGVSLQFNTGEGEAKLGTALEIVLLMTLLAMAPALVMTMTCFTRIVVVLSFLKRAMSMQDLPPAMITTGFALFLTIFIMKPVATDIYDNAYTPYVEDQITWQEAAGVATDRLNRFMLAQTREADVALILELANEPMPETALETPFHVTVPAFVLSEIKTAVQM